MRTKTIFAAATLLLSSHLTAGPDPWNSVTIFPEQPLEAKLGVLSESKNPNALGIVLWNDGSTNQLDAVMIPPPYNGVGVTSQSLDSSIFLFALGDICTEGENVVVPYIKDFNVETARFNGLNWTFQTIPGTISADYDNADCMVTNAGIIVAGHDLDNSSTELFRSTDGGSNYSFYSRYTAVSGPFDGAVREPLTTSFSGRYVTGLNQQPNGRIRATRVDTATNPPAVTHTNIVQLSPPPGSFQFVKESAGRNAFGRMYFTYNADGTQRITSFPENDPGAFINRNVGTVPSSGTQYTFFGGTIFGVPGVDGEEKVFSAFNTLIEFDEDITPPGITAGGYPIINLGGPVDSCVVEDGKGGQFAVFIGPNSSGISTALHMRPVGSPPIFADGFESGDVSTWTQCD